MHLREQNMSCSPRFSIIIPLYNKVDFIGGTLESVLAQTIDDYEIIIVDDGSKDGGAEFVAEKFDDARISIYKQKNSGVSSARNLGISVSVGDILCFLDADDYWLPNKLETIDKLFQEYSSVLFAATSYFEFADLKLELSRHADEHPVVNACEIDDFYLKWRCSPFVYTSSIAVRRIALIDNNIYFPPGESLGEDQDVWFRLSEISPLAYSSSKMVGYRRGMSNSLTSAEPMNILPAYERLKERHEAIESTNDKSKQAMKLYRKHSRDVALTNAKRGHRIKSTRFLVASDLAHPRFVIVYILTLIHAKLPKIIKTILTYR